MERTDVDNDMLEKGQMIFWEGIDGLVDSVIVRGKNIFAVKSRQSFVVDRSARMLVEQPQADFDPMSEKRSSLLPG